MLLDEGGTSSIYTMDVNREKGYCIAICPQGEEGLKIGQNLSTCERPLSTPLLQLDDGVTFDSLLDSPIK